MLFLAKGHSRGSRVTVASGATEPPERVGSLSEGPTVTKVREVRSRTPMTTTAIRGKPRRLRLVFFGDSERMRAVL
jgi:hypothetical protein